MTEMIRVPPSGVRLAYRTYGDPTAAPLVLLHALYKSADDWVRVVAPLADRFRIYSVDLRGHGQSDWPGVYSFESIRDDVGGFLTALDLTGVTLIGHSLGGIAAGLLAQQRPTRLARLVLEDAPPPRIGAGRFAPIKRPAGRLAFDWAASEAVFDQLNHPNPAWWERFDEVLVPTLVIGGGPRSHVPQAWNAELARSIPQARLVVIDAGHLVHEKRPGQYLAALSAFLDG